MARKQRTRKPRDLAEYRWKKWKDAGLVDVYSHEWPYDEEQFIEELIEELYGKGMPLEFPTRPASEQKSRDNIATMVPQWFLALMCIGSYKGPGGLTGLRAEVISTWAHRAVNDPEEQCKILREACELSAGYADDNAAFAATAELGKRIQQRLHRGKARWATVADKLEAALKEHEAER